MIRILPRVLHSAVSFFFRNEAVTKPLLFLRECFLKKAFTFYTISKNALYIQNRVDFLDVYLPSLVFFS